MLPTQKSKHVYRVKMTFYLRILKGLVKSKFKIPQQKYRPLDFISNFGITGLFPLKLEKKSNMEGYEGYKNHHSVNSVMLASNK